MTFVCCFLGPNPHPHPHPSRTRSLRVPEPHSRPLSSETLFLQPQDALEPIHLNKEGQSLSLPVLFSTKPGAHLPSSCRGGCDVDGLPPSCLLTQGARSSNLVQRALVPSGSARGPLVTSGRPGQNEPPYSVRLSSWAIKRRQRSHQAWECFILFKGQCKNEHHYLLPATLSSFRRTTKITAQIISKMSNDKF